MNAHYPIHIYKVYDVLESLIKLHRVCITDLPYQSTQPYVLIQLLVGTTFPIIPKAKLQKRAGTGGEIRRASEAVLIVGVTPTYSSVEVSPLLSETPVEKLLLLPC